MGKNPLEQENAKRGAAIFLQSCAYCHGKNADGGPEAPNLIRSLLVRHDKSGDLIGPVIQEGRPDRGMPAIRLPADQAADVVTYLHLDYESGKTVWQRDLGKGHSFTGVLTTAGHLLFSGDTSGNLFAFDPANGNLLWHVYAGGTLNSSPMTYQIEGRQYLITPVDSVVYAWTLPPAQ